MDAETLLSDARWLPHRYDEAKASFRFLRLERTAHRSVTFLTEEYLANPSAFVSVPRSAIDRSRLPAAPVHFVIHSAYCCSTLVARMFDAEGFAMGLKEPTVLNDIVGWRRRGAKPETLAVVLDLSLALLARPFAPGEAVVIKPSNAVNSLAPAMLALRPDARVIQLFAPIDDYLASIAAKGLWGRRWVRDALIGQIYDDVLSHRMSAEELLGLTDLQIAGLGWLSNQAIFKRTQARFGEERIQMCDSQALLRDPRSTVAGFFRHFGIRLSDEDVGRIAQSETFSTNSKDLSPYFASDRVRKLARSRGEHAEEIEMVAGWVRKLAEGIGIDVEPQPSYRLLGNT